MSNTNPDATFSASRKDLDNLKQTAVDAAQDIGSTAAVHAARAKGQLSDLSVHAQQEGAQRLNQLRGNFSEVLNTAKDFVAVRPFACLGVALAAGLAFGLVFRSRSRD